MKVLSKKIVVFVSAAMLACGLLCATTSIAFAEDTQPEYRSEIKVVAKHLYEVEYNDWNPEKAYVVAELIAKYPDLSGWLSDCDNVEEIAAAIKAHEKAWLALLSPEACELYNALVEGDLWLDFLTYLDMLSCTSCRTGDLVGRNFDWAYDDVDEFIVRVSADPGTGRHASLGVASAFFPPAIQALIGIDDMLPMLTMDGINDQGVAINVNIVASDPDSSGDTVGTNYGAERLCAGYVVRYVLDNADSAEHAVELLSQKDIFSVITQEFHWMISDDDATYIVETVDNELVVLKSTDRTAAMSNFHVTHSEYCEDYEVVLPYGAEVVPAERYVQEDELEKPVSNLFFPFAMGIERYQMAMAGLDEITSESEMLSHMQGIWYLQIFRPGADERFWSDQNFHWWYDEGSEDWHQFSHYDDPTWNAARIASFKNGYETYLEALEVEEAYGMRAPLGLPYPIAQTVHTSVYNLAERTLAVNVQERQTAFEFALDDETHANRTDFFINGDNVGLAMSCDVAGQEWTYDRQTNTVTLSEDGSYVFSGENTSGVKVVYESEGSGGQGDSGDDDQEGQGDPRGSEQGGSDQGSASATPKTSDDTDTVVTCLLLLMAISALIAGTAARMARKQGR